MNRDFVEEYSILKENQKTQEAVNKYLDEVGISKKLKGYDYMSDIITIALYRKKNSNSFFKEIYPFIAHKYKIEEYSVQRQLRYTFTVCNGLLPSDVLSKAWYELRKEMERGVI